MIKLQDIGTFHQLPELAMYIYKGDISALQHALNNGWNIEEAISLSKHISLSPLDLALISQQFDVVKLLVAHNVNLNVEKNPAFLKAVRYCREKIVRYVVEHGAKLDGDNQVGSGAYSQAYYGNKKISRLFTSLGLIFS